MRIFIVLLLGSLFTINTTFAQSAKWDFPITQELTLQEFIQAEEALGTSFEKKSDEVFSFLTKEVYPFVNDYNLAQPLRGKRTIENTRISFDCYYTKKDSVIKYVSYSLGPVDFDLEKLTTRLQKEGKTSQKEIEKGIQEMKNNPKFHKHNAQIFEELKKYFTEALGQPDSLHAEENEFEYNKLSWEKDNLTVYMAYEGENRKKLGIVTRIFWK